MISAFLQKPQVTWPLEAIHVISGCFEKQKLVDFHQIVGTKVCARNVSYGLGLGKVKVLEARNQSPIQVFH